MNIQPTDQQTQPISDDQELAKVLAGINDSANDGGQQADDTAAPSLPPVPMPDAPADNPAGDQPTEAMSPMPEVEMPAVDPTASPASAAPADDLESIKQEALGELRPLVDKLDVSPEEKFDTYLLLLRSTDDRELIAPAHEAAKAITDEARKAQALLDIIKEIDFLNQAQKQQ